MSLKAELEIWSSALEAYDEEDFVKSINFFNQIADTSKICWNIGIILATLGRHEAALEKFAEAVSLDGFLTVGYHQKGVSNFMLGRYEQALKDFQDAFLYLRGNQTINYEQLGLNFRLYAAEVLFNCGLVKIYLGKTAAGMQDLREAQTMKQSPDHGVIDDAIRDQGRDYNVFSVPVGILFRPAPAKLKNLAARDYMGKAVLVAASDIKEAYTTFTGITRLQRGQTPTGAPLDPSHPLSRPATVSPTTATKQTPPLASRMSRSSSDAAIPALDSRPQRSTLRSHSISSIPFRPSPTSPLSVAPQARQDSHSGLTADGLRPNRLVTPAPQIETRVPKPRLRLEIEEDPLIQTPEDDKNALRLTQMYDEYYQSANADDEMPPDLPPIGGAKRYPVETWRKQTPLGQSPAASDSKRPPASRAPPSSFASGVPVGGLKRWPSRAGSYISVSRYDDDPSESDGVGGMIKIRVKVHVGKSTRGMSMVPEDTYDDFVAALAVKFPERAQDMVVKFKDEDGDMVTMQDEGDYEAAVDVARVHSKGRAEGKLEIWIE